MESARVSVVEGAAEVAMDDVAIFALGSMINSSPAMFERRRRVLREARHMIGELRIDDFNMRELCRRADVSSRTIYNAFGSKEAVIALAINDYFEAFHRMMTFDRPRETFDGSIERFVATTLRNLQIPNYLHAVAALYFSPTLDPDIRAVLLGGGVRAWQPWLNELRIRRQIEKGVNLDALLIDLSDMQFAKVHQWGIGVIADEQLLDMTAMSVLTHLAGATRGPARDAVRQIITDVRDGRPAWLDRVAQTSTKLSLLRSGQVS